MKKQQPNRIILGEIGKVVGSTIVLLLLLAGFSCRKEEENSEANGTPTSSEASAAAGTGNQTGSGKKPTLHPLPPGLPPQATANAPVDTEPMDTEPIGAKLDRVLEKAKQTKEQYGTFREKLFDQAFNQLDTILCSIYRLQLLNGKDKDFYKKDPSLYIGPLKSVLRKQGRQAFVELVQEEPKADSSPALLASRKTVNFQASIPKSDPYSRRRQPIADLTIQQQLVADSDSNDKTENQTIEHAIWQFDPLTKCEQSYRESVVNSSRVRNESRVNMAGLVASALRNLRSYPGKLEVVEREWNRANDLSPILTSLKNNLDFNDIDPTVRRDVRNYEELLTKALADLTQAQIEGRFDAAVSQSEINGVLAVFR